LLRYYERLQNRYFSAFIDFQVIDLVFQALAIEEKLLGQSNAKVINWVQNKGKIEKLEKRSPQSKQLFYFCSYSGVEATFFVDNGKFIFIGDRCTFRPRKIC